MLIFGIRQYIINKIAPNNKINHGATAGSRGLPLRRNLTGNVMLPHNFGHGPNFNSSIQLSQLTAASAERGFPKLKLIKTNVHQWDKN